MRSPPVIPNHFKEEHCGAFESQLQIYERELAQREGKLNEQAEAIEIELSSLETKISKHKNLESQLKDTENQLLSKEEQLSALECKLSEHEQKCLLLKQQNELLQQTIANQYTSLRARESDVNLREQALQRTLNEAERIKIESDSERHRFSELNKALEEEQNLLSFEEENVRILEHKMRECIRQSEEKAEFAEIERLESERLIELYKERYANVDDLRNELEERKAESSKVPNNMQAESADVAQPYRQVSESTEQSESKISYFQNIAANLLAENRRLKSKIESMEAKVVLIAESPTVVADTEERQQERDTRIEDAFRIKENELNKLISDARELRREAELEKIDEEFEQVQNTVSIPQNAKTVQFEHNEEKPDKESLYCESDRSEENTASETHSLSLPDPATLTLHKTQLSSFAAPDFEHINAGNAGNDLEVDELAAFSRAADVSLTTYVHNAEVAVNNAVRRVDDAVGNLSAGKFKV